MEQANNLMGSLPEPVALTGEQKGGIGILLSVSVIIFALLMWWTVSRLRRSRKVDEENRSRAFSGLWVVPACLAGALGVFLYAIWYYRKCAYPVSCGGMNALEAMVGSLLKTLRVFGLEEEYPDIIGTVKDMMAELAPSRLFPQVLAEIYISLLMILAPLVGGAILLEFISNIFPAVKLWTAQLRKKRDICYFSELNPASLALAKSVSRYYVDIQKKKKPILVFTDCYVDRENEKEYELMLEARKEGAICIRDDLAHIAKRRGGKSNFYLIDENEYSNLKALVELTEEKNDPYIKNAEIYLFVQSDAYVQIEENIMKRLPQENSAEEKDPKTGNFGRKKGSAMTREEFPLIVPVFSYRNLVHNLLLDVPLYEPLVKKTNPKQLTVTIFGNGLIGTEAFLSTYWMGQMLVGETLAPCELKIRVVSRDDEETFWSKIDYINPEIRRTTDKNDSILCWGKGEEKNPVYCSVEYIQKDVKNGGFWERLSDKSSDFLMNTDYFIVALGSDSDNISVANKLRCSVGKYHLEHPEFGNTVIAYAVFDDKLCRTMNRQKHFCSRSQDEPDVYMHAFGSLEQVYSCENIYMSRVKVWAEEMGDAYMQFRGDSGYITENRDRSNGMGDDYTHWANISRALHLRYKLFSLREIQESVFDGTTAQWDEKHRRKAEMICQRFHDILVKMNHVELGQEDQAFLQNMETNKHLWAWLEHRRWNAFTRSMGYRHTEAMEKYFNFTKSHKNMPLRLHPCLVESRYPDPTKNIEYFRLVGDADTPNKQVRKACENGDKLDDVSCMRAREQEKHLPQELKYVYDFKKYDYYDCDTETYYLPEKAAAKLKLEAKDYRFAEKFSPDRKTVEKWCNSDQTIGTVTLPDGRLLIPNSFIKRKKKELEAAAKKAEAAEDRKKAKKQKKLRNAAVPADTNTQSA